MRAGCTIFGKIAARLAHHPNWWGWQGLARKRAQNESLNVAFKEGDARNPRLTENSFDCVAIMGNSFGYFSNKQDDEKVLATVGKILRRELPTRGAELLASMAPAPIAAASIGQVHRARTKNGRTLAVKVQFPGVAESIGADLGNLATLLAATGVVPADYDMKPLLAPDAL